MLVCVQFSNRKEAFLFYQFLFDTSSRQQLNGEIKKDRGSWSVEVYESQKNTAPRVSRAITNILCRRKLNAWMEGILRHRFYYEDRDEIERVVKLSSKIKEDPPEGVVIPPIDLYVERFVRKAVIEQEDILFDDLSADCLEYLYHDLLDFTGKLLDEYKLEEAHQMMVDSWRRRVNNNDTGVHLLHVLYDERVRYFYSEGNEVRRGELLNYLKSHPDPLIQNLPADWGILPALIYSPEELVIYSDRQGEAKLELLMNIFEEKAVWKPLSHFPFLKA